MAGTLTIDTLKASSGVLATQNGMTGIAKAWVNFNSSAVIAKSFNVSSVTKNTTADYTVNFTTSFPDANYAVGTAMQSNANPGGGGGWSLAIKGTATTLSSSCAFISGVQNSAYDSVGPMTVVFFD